MISLCYHNGALGHCAMALLECCSLQGKGTMPKFKLGNNLHHYQYTGHLAKFCHPYCDIDAEKKNQNLVLSSTSKSKFGRYLIILMGLYKWNKDVPDFNKNLVYKQHGKNVGEEIEILSLTLRDKVNKDDDWYTNADVCLEILDYWNKKSNITQVLIECNLTPIESRVELFCNSVAKANQKYFDKIKKCYTIAEDVIKNKIYKINIDFLESAIIHGILIDFTMSDHTALKLLENNPTSTQDFIRVFND